MDNLLMNGGGVKSKEVKCCMTVNHAEATNPHKVKKVKRLIKKEKRVKMLGDKEDKKGKKGEQS